jgi:glycosyltransferase involved in cell wall biosynthesis
MPVYNGERFLRESLNSLLAQTFRDFELIISDNASTDQTEQICREYAAKDPRIRYDRNETNLGASKNYNRVFELSTGEYFKWAAADDLCAPTMLEQCVCILDQNPEVVVCYPKTNIIDEDGRTLEHYEDGLNLQSETASDRFRQFFRAVGECNAVFGLIRSNVLRQTALVGNYIASDNPLLAELSLYGRFCEIPEFLFYRRHHLHAYSSQTDIGQLLEFYDPKNKHRPPLTKWKHLCANFRAVERTPLRPGEKMRLRYYVIRMGIWSRHILARELSAGMRQMLRQMWHRIRSTWLTAASE